MPVYGCGKKLYVGLKKANQGENELEQEDSMALLYLGTAGLISYNVCFREKSRYSLEKAV